MKPGGGALGPFWMVAQRKQGGRFALFVCQLDHAVGGARANQAQGFLGGEGVKESHPAAEQGRDEGDLQTVDQSVAQKRLDDRCAAADPDAFS